MIGNEEIDMKKYVKPEVFYEQFELSKHIADCAWELTSATKDTCSAAADPDYLPTLVSNNLFMSSDYGCALIPGDNYSDVCYHDGTAGANVFAS